MKKTLMTVCAVAAMALGAETKPVQAQEYWIGQIVLGGWNFCPRSTLPAAGQLLAISSNEALFSLYGTTFGGDGRTTFGLPDLRGRYATSMGTQPGLSTIRWGEKGGAETNTMNIQTLASHTHTITNNVTANLLGSSGNPNSTSPNDAALATQAANHYSTRGALDETMEAGSVAVNVTSTALNNGGNRSFNIKDPFLGLQYCVVTQGTFPSRN
ncbi:MAG: tail fiber protein [Rhodobacter sp.]|nr:tail fiber protein [Rhodobacter sp.]